MRTRPSPRSTRFPTENGIAAPTINRKSGMIKSQPPNPSPGTWANCRSSPGGSGSANSLQKFITIGPPPTIQNISKPRNVSIDFTRPESGGTGRAASVDSGLPLEAAIILPHPAIDSLLQYLDVYPARFYHQLWS